MIVLVILLKHIKDIQMKKLVCQILVPVVEIGIEKGSAILSDPSKKGAGYYYGYFEGNVYGCENLNSYDEKVRCAYDRLVSKYPTSAKMMIDSEKVDVVGEFDGERIKVYDSSCLRLFNSWVADDTVVTSFK